MLLVFIRSASLAHRREVSNQYSQHTLSWRNNKKVKCRIQSNYGTYPYKYTVKQFRSLQITTLVLFCQLLYTGICCGYPFELHRLVDAIQMSTYNICFYKGIYCRYPFELHRLVNAIQMSTYNICFYKEKYEKNA